ncbi:MAG TPA: TonB-dependent receptor [Rhizomicrobium sp.]|nr:TonB-dependent receptor [Rhizomicrobium sp.]
MSTFEGGCKARHHLLISAAVILPGLGFFAAPANAQTEPSAGVETITVTAEKRSENIQTVPMAVSAISGVQLEQLGITNILSAAPFIPNFSIVAYTNNTRDTSVIVRNTGSSGTNPGIEPDVGVFIDGVYEPAGGALIESLVDINDIEVLYGPQGTLYGRNTVVGAVNVTTRAPSQTEEGMIDVTLGNYGDQRVQGYFGGGITDDLAGRISFWEDGNDGYEYNLQTKTNIDGEQEYGGRVRLLWTPDSRLSVNLIGSYELQNSSCCAATIIDPYGLNGIVTRNPNFVATMAALGAPFVAPDYDKHQVDILTPPNSQTQIADGSIQANYVLPFDATLTSITGYTLWVNDIYEQPGQSLPLNFGVSAMFETEAGYSEELRLASQTGGFAEYLFGAYYYYQETQYGTLGVIGPNAVHPTTVGTSPEKSGDGSTSQFGQWTNSAALFGQVKFNPFGNFHLIVGGRASYTDKQGADTVTDFTGDSQTYAKTTPSSTTGLLRYSSKVDLTWLTTAQYDFTKNVMAYATVATGFKDGGFNARAAAGAGFPLTFGPEWSKEYEAGVKSSWWDDMVVFDADVYTQTIYGYQQSNYDSTLNPAAFVVGNDGNLHTIGYEGTLTAKPINDLTLTGNIGLAAERVSNFRSGTCSGYPLVNGQPVIPYSNAAKTECNYDGTTPSYSPRVRWSIMGQWEPPITSNLNLLLESDLDWQGQEYLYATLDPPTLQGNVLLLNARAGVESSSGKWRVTLWGQNLTNKTYFTSETTTPQPGTIPGGAGGTAAAPSVLGGYIGWYAPPRTFGIEGSYNF